MYTLLVYVIMTTGNAEQVTRLNRFKTTEACYKATKAISISKGPGKLAFKCEKVK